MKATHKLLLASAVLITALSLVASPAAACDGQGDDEFEDRWCSSLDSSAVEADGPITASVPITSDSVSTQGGCEDKSKPACIE